MSLAVKKQPFHWHLLQGPALAEEHIFSFSILLTAAIDWGLMTRLRQVEQNDKGHLEALFYGGLGSLAALIELVIFQCGGRQWHLPEQDATD